MPSNFYRVYIRFGKNNCLRFLASGNGSCWEDGLHLFEWVRDPTNITRLYARLRHVYEMDEDELAFFLSQAIRRSRRHANPNTITCASRDDMLASLKRIRIDFSRLRPGVDMLEAISKAEGVTVMPRVLPRKRSDASGWLYLLDLDQEALEVYEFSDYGWKLNSPCRRLTVEILYHASPSNPPGYYIKLDLSYLQRISRGEWMVLHRLHAESLCALWRLNARIIQTIPHADCIPFRVLYGGEFHGQDRRLGRLTREGITDILARLNRRKPSSLTIVDSKRIQPRSAEDDHLKRLPRLMRGWRRGPALHRRRRQAHEKNLSERYRNRP